MTTIQPFLAFLGIVTLQHQGCGCCGEEQKVICNVTETFRVSITVGEETHVFVPDADSTIMINGIMIRLISATPLNNGLFELIAEVEYIVDAVNANLNVTCFNPAFSEMINIPLNSKHLCVTISLVHCVPIVCLH